jgi:putative restriction endonuclease
MSEGVDAYLGLTESDARAQWRSIRQRTLARRQVPFLPVETLLCYGLFYRLDPHRYGGANIDRVPDEVKSLAATLNRTAGSLTNKMLNLDGSRPNAARPEPELFIRLQQPGLFDPLFRRVIKAARQEGFSESQVPDFLTTLEFDEDLELFGQQELGPPEVTAALEEMFARQRELETSFGFTPTETSRLVEQRVRLAQHRFAAGVLANYRWQCGFCGFAPGGDLRGYGLLIASHVKPWARSNDRERSDVTNGVCACPMHDSAFDAGLLTVTPDLEIVRAKALESRVPENESLARVFGPPMLRMSLLVPTTAQRPRHHFLEYHQLRVFRG